MVNMKYNKLMEKPVSLKIRLVVKYSLFGSTLLLILLYSRIINSVSLYVIYLGSADSFLMNIQGTPLHSESFLIQGVISVGSLFLIALYIDIRGEQGVTPSGLMLGAAFAITLYILFGVHFSLRSVLNLFIVLLLSLRGLKGTRLGAILLGVFLFFLSGSGIISLFTSQVPFQYYINNLEPSRAVFWGIITDSILSLSDLLFILWLIFDLFEYITESEMFRILNSQLEEKTEALEEANVRLQSYSSQMEKIAILQERNRIAHEIHDTVGHYLTSLNLGINAAIHMLDGNKTELVQHLNRLINTAKKSLKEISRSIHSLTPDDLDSNSLPGAIKSMTDRLTAHSETAITMDFPDFWHPLPSREEIVLYRFFQEGVSNAIRHGKANNIQLTLTRDRSSIIGEVKDNGIGSEGLSPGFGLQEMTKKLRSLQGDISWENGKETGFCLRCRIPLEIKEFI